MTDLEDLAVRVRAALETADPARFGELLDPDVSWGAPGARRPSCSNRDQVLAGYEKGRQAGVRGRVTDVTVVGDHLLVSLVVGGTDDAEERGGQALRWQVLGVRDGRITDIVGFDDRTDALAHVGASSA